MDNQSSDNFKNNQIFFRPLKKMHNDDPGITTMPLKDAWPIEYLMNSHGYRCEEITNQKILTLGCSQTEGHGMPIELTWPYLIAQKMNLGYVNLAKGGDGAQGQVTKAFQFFKEFYNPDYIFAAFPLKRLEIPSATDIFYSQNKRSNRKTFEHHPNEINRAIFDNRNLEKFSKMPHFAEDVIPEEFVIFYNILFIRMLAQYCESNNIKFIWTLYEYPHKTFNFEQPIEKYFKFDEIKKSIKKCHLELSDNTYFNQAADTYKFPPGHWTFHQHIHVAEQIYSML
jgi:hypothetical protein